jgi:1-acyl-sn-glycerol-3-phosphate acyltransferase
MLAPLRVPRLWGDDPSRLWRVMRWFVPPVTLALAPGSRAYGVERVPLSGGAVVAANHLSALDPPLIGIFSPRPLHYMAKAELLAVPLVGELLAWTGAFPVRRGEGDREALRRARELVRDGRVVGIFVEGTRQRLGYPGPVHAGALIVALQEEAPLVPCAVDSFGWSLRSRRSCTVVWGEPLRLEGLPRGGSGYRQAAALLEAELVSLWRQAVTAREHGFPAALADGARRSGAIRPPALNPPPNSPFV